MAERRFRPDDAEWRPGTHQSATTPERHNLHSAALNRTRLAGEADLQALASGNLPEGWDPRLASDPKIFGELVVAATARLNPQDRNTHGHGFSGFQTANPGEEHPQSHTQEHWQRYQSVMSSVPQSPKVPQMTPPAVVATAAVKLSAPSPAAEVTEQHPFVVSNQTAEPQRPAEATTDNGNRFDYPTDQWPIMVPPDTGAAVTERITAPAPAARQRTSWNTPAVPLRLVPGNPHAGETTPAAGNGRHLEVVYRQPGSAAQSERPTQEIRPPAPAIVGPEDPTQQLSTISDPSGLLVTAEYPIAGPRPQSNAS